MNTPALIPKILDDLLKFTASCWQSTNALSTSDQASLAVACQGCILLHSSVPANSVAKPPCADTPIRRRMARRGHIRRYADTTVGGLGWLTPIRAYAGTPLADMPVRGKNTPIRRYARKIRRYADPGANTPIRRYANPGGKYADTPIWAGRMARCIGVSVRGRTPPLPPSLPPPSSPPSPPSRSRRPSPSLPPPPPLPWLKAACRKAVACQIK